MNAILRLKHPHNLICEWLYKMNWEDICNRRTIIEIYKKRGTNISVSLILRKVFDRINYWKIIECIGKVGTAGNSMGKEARLET